MINVNDVAFDHALAGLRWARNFDPDVIVNLLADLLGLHPARKMRGDRGKHVASVKGRADRMAEKFTARDVEDADAGFLRINEAEDAIVGANEKMLSGLDDDRAAR